MSVYKNISEQNQKNKQTEKSIKKKRITCRNDR